MIVRFGSDEQKRRWVPELGLFEKSGKFGQVEFYPVPAANPDEAPSGPSRSTKRTQSFSF